MNAPARLPFWTRYHNCQEHLGALRSLLTAISGDLQDISQLLKEDASLPEKDFDTLADRLSDLAQYAREIQQAVRQKRIDGEAADRRIDAMIGTVQ